MLPDGRGPVTQTLGQHLLRVVLMPGVEGGGVEEGADEEAGAVAGQGIGEGCEGEQAGEEL